MSRLAYAIARNRLDLPAIGTATRLAIDGMAVIHGPAPPDFLSPDVASLQAFASTIEAWHARETVLPLRFGSMFETEAELVAMLVARSDEWRGRLDEVEGCEEMGLRVLLEAGQPVSQPSPVSRAPGEKLGLAYLANRRRELLLRDAAEGEATLVVSRIDEAFRGLYRRRVVEGPSPGRDRLLSLVYLVPKTELDAFRQKARRLIDGEVARILTTGPWPPYHFAALDPVAM